MPRLEGERSNSGLYLLLALLLLAVVVLVLEFLGVGGLNLIPNFGAA